MGREARSIKLVIDTLRAVSAAPIRASAPYGGVVLGGLGIAGFVAGSAALPNLEGEAPMLVGAIIGLARACNCWRSASSATTCGASIEESPPPRHTSSRPAPVTGPAEPAGRPS